MMKPPSPLPGGTGIPSAIVALETWKGSQARPVDFADVEARIIELVRNLNVRKVQIESPQGVAMAQRLQAGGVIAETSHPTAKSQRET